MAVTDTLWSAGQVEEQAWPYGSFLQEAATRYRAESSLHAFDEFLVETSLAAGEPVVAVVEIGREFFRPEGTVITAASASTVETRHAILIVGFGVIGTAKVYLIRNSWGATWGNGGYMWVESAYLHLRAIQCATMESR